MAAILSPLTGLREESALTGFRGLRHLATTCHCYAANATAESGEPDGVSLRVGLTTDSNLSLLRS